PRGPLAGGTLCLGIEAPDQRRAQPEAHRPPRPHLASGVTTKSANSDMLSVFDHSPTFPLTGSARVYSSSSLPSRNPCSCVPCTEIFMSCQVPSSSGTFSLPRFTKLRFPCLKVHSTRLSSVPLKR